MRKETHSDLQLEGDFGDESEIHVLVRLPWRQLR